MLEQKPVSTISHPPVPPILSDEFLRIQSAIDETASKLAKESTSRPAAPISLSIEKTAPSMTMRQLEPWIAIGDVQKSARGGSLSIEDEVSQCFEFLRGMPIYLN